MNQSRSAAHSDSSAPARQLSLFDSVCIIVGMIVGVGIFRTPVDVAGTISATWAMMAVWLVGGLLTLAGALCYAELAAAYPQEGGDYVYLTRAFGAPVGYLFGWAQMVIIRPGVIAQTALIFADYATPLATGSAAPEGSRLPMSVAVAAVATLTALNVIGVKQGKWTQNVLTLIKSLGLLAIFAVALFSGGTGLTAGSPVEQTRWQLALILVLFTFGGWSEMAYVAAEVREPQRNMVRALFWGTVAVTGLYLLVNAAFLMALGHAGMAGSKAVAIDTVATVLPDSAGRVVGALVCVSALGAMNGLIFTGARVSYALGRDYSAFRAVGGWNARTGTPIWALVLQGTLASVIVIAFGGFVATLTLTTAVVWSFYLATGISIWVLRAREPDRERPYRVTGHPVTTLLYCASCLLLIYSGLTFDPDPEPNLLFGWEVTLGTKVTVIALGVLALGLPLYWLGRRPNGSA